MAKFKVGDKVTLKNSLGFQEYCNYTHGKEYIVIEVYEEYGYDRIKTNIDDSGSKTNGGLAEYFELIIDEDIATTFAPLAKSFSSDRFNNIINDTIIEINKLSELKGGEYAGDGDRLANFRRNAANLGLTKEDIWSVYAGKHWDGIMTYVRDVREGKKRERLESISGRLDDLIVYCLLMKAMVEENGD